MACEDIEQRLEDLKDQKQDIENGMELVTYPKTLAIMQEQLSAVEAQIAAEEKKLEDCTAIESAGPADILVRKNQKYLSEDERARFIDAYQAIRAGFLEGVEKPRLLEFVEEHRHAFAEHEPTTHGTALFAWHRSFLRAFEIRLRKADPSVTIPFWNAFEDPYPEWLLAIPNVGRERVPGVDPAALSAIPYHEANFETFQDAVNSGYHLEVHIQLRAAMLDTTRSPRDPVFWLHHAFVDKIWSLWTEMHWTPTPGVNGQPEYRPANRDVPLVAGHEEGTLVTHDVNRLIFSIDRGYVYGGGILNNLLREGSEDFVVNLDRGQILLIQQGEWQAKARVVTLSSDVATLRVRLYYNWKPVRDYTMRIDDTDYYNIAKNGLPVAEEVAHLHVTQNVSTSASTYQLRPINGTIAAIYQGIDSFERLTP